MEPLSGCLCKILQHRPVLVCVFLFRQVRQPLFEPFEVGGLLRGAIVMQAEEDLPYRMHVRIEHFLCQLLFPDIRGRGFLMKLLTYVIDKDLMIVRIGKLICRIAGGVGLPAQLIDLFE